MQCFLVGSESEVILRKVRMSVCLLTITNISEIFPNFEKISYQSVIFAIDLFNWESLAHLSGCNICA